MKQIVFYSAIDYCVVGQSAHCVTVNHPKLNRADNGDWVFTSPVVQILEPGARPMFETWNSLYSPIEKWTEESDAGLRAEEVTS
jgi:hypothetical protein